MWFCIMAFFIKYICISKMPLVSIGLESTEKYFTLPFDLDLSYH